MSISDSIHRLLDKYDNEIEAFIAKFPRAYLTVVFLVALIGYALVLLPPLLIISASYNLYEIISIADIANWISALIWLSVLIISSLISYRGSQIKITPPAGLTVSEEKLPEIFKIVREYQDYFKRPEIHRIVITANYELDIVKVPKFALPVWSINTMVIGLPVLLCHSPKQFECLVARRIGQFSKSQNPVTNWLYQLREIWKQHSFAYSKLKSPDSYFLKWIYAKYASLYESVSVYAARSDELNADTYAIELFHNDVVRDMITAYMTYQYYLQEHYWPAINKIASIRTKPALTPFHNMTAAIQTNLKEEKLKSLINKVFKAEPQRNVPTPSMLQRLENIGHDTPYLSDNTGDAAAVKYLGESLNNVINLIDKLWLNNIMTLQRRAKK
ncbi:MAG: hypothetical protein ABUK13_00405 [Gammaproteobacteria bacterium]